MRFWVVRFLCLEKPHLSPSWLLKQRTYLLELTVDHSNKAGSLGPMRYTVGSIHRKVPGKSLPCQVNWPHCRQQLGQ